METIDLREEANKRNLIRGGRREGNTTRMIDLAIQLLFEENRVIVEDHHPTALMTKYIVDRIRQRIYYEHPMYRDKKLFVDRMRQGGVLLYIRDKTATNRRGVDFSKTK